MKNNICITCTNGVYDFKHKWFDIFELYGGDYEELKEKFEMPVDSYLLVTDCETKIGELFLNRTNESIINEITDKIGHLNYIGIEDEHMDLANELLQELAYDDLDSIQYICESFDSYINYIIEGWNLPKDVEQYIDREALERAEEINNRFIETSYGLYEVI